MYSADIKKLPRHFLPADFIVTDWNTLEPYFKDLLDRPIGNYAELEKWLLDMSELEAVVSEDACWRQIKMTCDTENKSLEEAFVFFVTTLQPQIQLYGDKLNRKLVESPYTDAAGQTESILPTCAVCGRILNSSGKRIFPCSQN